MSRLIVLSNRVKMPDNGPTAGGLAVALDDVLVGNSVIWMGWNGEITDTYNSYYDNTFSISKQTTVADPQVASTKITYMTTALTTKQYQYFYCGFANSVLWLLLHEQPDLISQAADDYAGYQAVNRLFARQLKKIIEPDDVIWVHDYHFLSVAYYCRQLGMTNRIGFFLHIPFAPLAYWQQLKQSRELIKHLAHYDVIGTQTQQDKAKCLAVFGHYLKDDFSTYSPIEASYTKQNFAKLGRSTSAQLMLNLDLSTSHCLTINAYPIGVNVAKIQQQVSHLSSQSAKPNQNKNAVKSAAQRIIAVDRIDYSKGLLERFSAYRDFLQQYPAYQNKLKLLQIACPSRLDLLVYQRLYDKVRQVVDDVNQQFLPSDCSHKCSNDCQNDVFKITHSISNKIKTDNLQTGNFQTSDFQTNNLINHWQAVTYSETVLSHERLMRAFYRSDIGWVNSLKDGMNLVAKEYIAAQNPDNPGVLLLSSYAGAAEQMQAAVIIDPYYPKSIIEGLKIALTMPLGERETRYHTLLQGLQQDNLHAWQRSFLDDLYIDDPYGSKKRQTNSGPLGAAQTSDS